MAYLISMERVDYGVGLTLQYEIWKARLNGEIEDTMLLLEHPPVLTLGRGADRRNLLVDETELTRLGIRIYQVERGGDITYHGPGQLIGYPIFQLKSGLIGVRRFVEKLEEALILSLRQLKIKAGVRERLIGVWVDERKIASIGITVQEGVTRHGFALNFGMDLSGFKLINPCGLNSGLMTSIGLELKREVSREEVEEAVRRGFEQVFEIKFQTNLPRSLTSLTNWASSARISSTS